MYGTIKRKTGKAIINVERKLLNLISLYLF